MTEQEYIATLDAEHQAFIAETRRRRSDRRPEAYILLEGEVVETDILVSVIWQTLNENGRRVGEDWVGDLRVSTVFLTVPHGPNGSEHFETMVFDPDGDECGMVRYRTLDAARSGHEKVVAHLMAKLPAPQPDVVAGP